jgi:hypothetical protein
MILFCGAIKIFSSRGMLTMNIRAAGVCRKIILAIFLTLLVSVRELPGSCEAASDSDIALKLADKLGADFSPESLSVKVMGSRGFVEARGVFLSGVRIDRLKIEAILAASDVPESGDIFSLASMIAYSWGEIELNADDINEYFKSHDARGFSDLRVDFSPRGFRAEGIFTKSLIFTWRVLLSATGNFGLRADGVYIEDAAIYVENMRQPGFLVKEVMERANPLIEWSEIPFKVVFKDITMTDYSAIMTGNPRDFDGGSTAVWNADMERAEML